jgi:hypothetical protein
MSLTSKPSKITDKKKSQVPSQTLDKINAPIVIRIDKGIGATKRSMSRQGFKLTPPKQNSLASKSAIYAESGNITFSDLRKKLDEATYKGKTVPLNKPMPGDVKKSKVYVDPDGDGKAQKVNFGDKTMSIKKNIPARKKSFMARHNCDSKTDKTSAGYWSCKAWK